MRTENVARRTSLRRFWRIVGWALAAGCVVTPLSGKIQPGVDPIVIVVGEAADGATELFAAPAGGGKFIQITFNRWVEDLPRLSPSGTKVAFLREPTGSDLGERLLVVLDLETMMEKFVPVPASDGPVDHLGWSPQGDTVFVGTKTPLATSITNKLSLSPVPQEQRQSALDQLAEVLGSPKFAVIKECRNGGLCAVADDTLETALGPGVSDAIRWGPDQLGYLIDGTIEVRPLTGGRPRRPAWTDFPRHARHPTHHPGTQPPQDR